MSSSVVTPPVSVIYHAKCPDGFGAAFAAWLKFGDAATYIPSFHGKPLPPGIDGHDVYILDFAYGPEQLSELEERAARVILLDHHKSARDQLRAYCCKRHSLVLFDLSHSGARLAWDHFHPNRPVPDLIRYIEDRDLWTWELEDTRAYTAHLDVLPMEFGTWRRLIEMDESQTDQFIAEGRPMIEKHLSICRGLAEDAVPVTLAGHQGLMLPMGGELVSDVGAIVSRASGTFAALWKILPEGLVKVSLRSVRDFDALAIATAFGGGGHPAAASFSIPLDRLPELVRGRLDPLEVR